MCNEFSENEREISILYFWISLFTLSLFSVDDTRALVYTDI